MCVYTLNHQALVLEITDAWIPPTGNWLGSRSVLLLRAEDGSLGALYLARYVLCYRAPPLSHTVAVFEGQTFTKHSKIENPRDGKIKFGLGTPWNSMQLHKRM